MFGLKNNSHLPDLVVQSQEPARTEFSRI